MKKSDRKMEISLHDDSFWNRSCSSTSKQWNRSEHQIYVIMMEIGKRGCRRKCGVCGVGVGDKILKRCTRWLKVVLSIHFWYCGRECQLNHWSDHQHDCKVNLFGVKLYPYEREFMECQVVWKNTLAKSKGTLDPRSL